MLGNFTYLGILVIKKRSGKTFDTEFCEPSSCTFFFFFFTVQCIMWNLSSLTRDLTCIPYIESSES